MIPEIGQFALVMAVIVSALCATLPLVGTFRNDRQMVAMAPNLAAAQCLFAAIAFFTLMAAHVTSDFSVLNVVQNSHTDKPMLYKIAGVWGNHEGSLILWVMVLSIFGLAIALSRTIDPVFKARVLSVQAFIALGFFLFSFLTSNPFIRVNPMPLNGNGLNPVLQDPGLAFHPPFLYLGYVGFSVAFSFAVAGLIQGKVDGIWARHMYPWVLTAWSLLTIGIALGSWWAYYELGWGGFWFWDPVENVSVLPWLAGTALLHSVKVVEKRGALKHWTVLLSILAFGMSLTGTFLVRSGLTSSVHSFANDPERGLFILAFLILAVGGALLLYGIRASRFELGKPFHPVSREGGLVLNNFLLFVATFIVFVGTLYPMILDGLTGQKISVGPPYYEATAVPVALLVMLAMVAGPLMPWTLKARMGRILKFLAPAAVIALLAFIANLWLAPKPTLVGTLGLALAVWVGVGTLLYGWRVYRLQDGAGVMARLKRIPRSSYGLILAHGGVGVITIGITMSGAWQSDFEGKMDIGDTAEVGAYSFHLDNVEETVQGPNYEARRATFTVTKGGSLVKVMTPETRFYTAPPTQTTEADIRTGPLGDLYAVVGEPSPGGGYAIRLYYKPLVSWIWGGAIIMALGGAIAMSGRRKLPVVNTAQAHTSAQPAGAAE